MRNPPDAAPIHRHRIHGRSRRIVRVLLGCAIAVVFVAAAFVSVSSGDASDASGAVEPASFDVTPEPSPTPPPTYPDQSQQHARTVQEERGTTYAADAMIAAITIDDGPHPTWTPLILDVLKEKNVKATFFAVGANVQAYPELAQRIVDEGHVLSNHSWSHANLRGLSAAQFAAEVDQTSDLITNTYNVSVQCVRAPGGDVDQVVIDRLAERGYTTMRWDTSTGDFLRKGVEYQVNAIMAGLHPGSVILVHDGGGDRSQTVESLAQIVDNVRAEGYTFTTVCGPR